ncbi:MAG: hypothetical protein HC893_14140, partial [Chloroflexaceae bacterium]|nr:hypothetical protein [Chloroflexaceae bacterium]
SGSFAVGIVSFSESRPRSVTATLLASPVSSALDRAAARLQAAIAAWSSLPPDLIAGDLTTALNALGEITGEVVGDDLLDTIFSRFCIGK